MNDGLNALRRGDMVGAREISLRENLTAFPPELFGLADTLEILDLSNNALTALPDDMGRFKRLRVLFCSNNAFTHLPPSLGDCVALSQVGFRGCGLREAPSEALPPNLRWLTLTDNRIEDLPGALGERPALQKLMLAGNHLSQAPASLAQASNLELLRLSANRLETLPGWLADLPNLAWLAWAGNPMDQSFAPPPSVTASWSSLSLGALLGQGASGLIHDVEWTQASGQTRPAALKLFKGAMTSDGLPEREMAACLAAGEHPHLTGALARLVDHPQQAQGLLMPLLPSHWQVLAGPPNAESCSRDIYAPTLRFELDIALRIARDIGAALTHLHGRELLHGDVYGHNVLWDGETGEAVLSDFGAASFLPTHHDDRFTRLETRAWGLLLGELLERCTEPAPASLRTLVQACTAPHSTGRPTMADALAALDTHR